MQRLLVADNSLRSRKFVSFLNRSAIRENKRLMQERDKFFPASFPQLVVLLTKSRDMTLKCDFKLLISSLNDTEEYVLIPFRTTGYFNTTE